MSPQKLADVRSFIDSCDLAVVGSLSSHSVGGKPQSAVVAIVVTPELELIFDTVKESRKFGNLKANGACSVTMWKGEVTVQYEGVAMEPVGEELVRYQEAYFAKLPDGRDRLKWTGIVYFVVRPKWVRFSDFDARPPAIEEHTF
jgi:Pyridoxamine 5'-phosphate oxidase